MPQTENSPPLPADEMRRLYAEQLTLWVKRSGRSQTQLAEFTRYFAVFRRSANPMDPSTFGRTLENYPKNQQGTSNLCVLFGVLYLVGTITKADIEAFMRSYHIAIDPAEWEGIWQTIEAGAAHGRAEIPDLRSKPSTPSLKPASEFPIPVRHPRMIIGVIAVLVIIGLLTISTASQLLDQPIDQPTPTPPALCSQTFVRAEPRFLPDQGFSQYLVAGSQVLGDSLLDDNLRSVGIDERGLWIGYLPTVSSTQYVSFFDKANWTHYCTGVPLTPRQNVNSFAFLNGSVFMATDGAGVAQFDGTSWHFYTPDEGLPDNRVYSLRVLDGVLWASTYEGVAQFVDGHWQTVYSASPDGLASNHVHTFVVDGQGNRWFGFIDRGISRLDSAGHWYSYFTDDLNLQNTRGIALDDSGGVWFVTDHGGVLRFQNDTWTEFNFANGQLPGDFGRDIERDSFGRIWVATQQGVAYTADLGQTWVVHSTMDTLDIEFGCEGCTAFSQNHMILVLSGAGFGHVRIPPLTPTIGVVSAPARVQLHPGETYVFQVEVAVLAEQLTPDDGDSLRSSAPLNTPLFGAYPIIAVNAAVAVGQTYTFSNVDDPITAPAAPGIYTTTWRVWQGRRFVSAPIVIEFEVVNPQTSP